MSREEPTIEVGVMSAVLIEFTLEGDFRCPDGTLRTGNQRVELSPDGGVAWDGGSFEAALFEPTGDDCSFALEDVCIGVNFHWERHERQRFAGLLKVIADETGERCVAVNVVGVEEYLKSVISSEMCADASEGLLRAHAVVSRSWLLSQLAGRGRRASEEAISWRRVMTELGETDEFVRWYDREDHALFDVCADDHCQRYQGLTRQTSPAVAAAVAATRGLALTYGGKVCDARFSKCCGGVTETFGSCWEDEPHPYLEPVADSDECGECFCDMADAGILARVLNGYDREEPDFSRWEVRYRPDELSALVKERSGVDFGDIELLQPLTRGASGRVTRLLVSGTRHRMVVGKELEIRRWLSPSHLKSSAFTVERDGGSGEWILRGRGWGHGVGMCQIGAAVMGERGYSHEEILRHYFPKAKMEKLY